MNLRKRADYREAPACCAGASFSLGDANSDGQGAKEAVSCVLRFIPPQLASPADSPPEGERWIHEIKHDGYRCQVLLERGQVRVLTRNGHDWSDRYPSIVLAASNLRCQSAIIDGEAIVQRREQDTAPRHGEKLSAIEASVLRLSNIGRAVHITGALRRNG
jgi:ATP-dependent DNA ligase